MPIVQIHLMEGRDQGKKRALVKAVTEAICATIDTKPANVRIILSEMSPENHSISGQLVGDQNDSFNKNSK